MTIVLLGTLIAFVASWLLTPVVRRLALRCELVDHPDAERKMHGKAIPLGGGVAVALATAFGMSAYWLIPSQLFPDHLRPELDDPRGMLGLAAASALICLVGLIDDRFGLSARKKLLGQTIAVAAILASGLMIRSIAFFGWQIELGLLAAPFTIFWLLGVINSLNLIDGADGLASTVGVILSISVATMSLLMGDPADAALAAALAGALAGFLIFNFPPATIFLGDSGSMLIGLILGTLAIRGSFKGPATVALAAPVALFAIPILDSLAAVVRRRMTGRSIYSSDRGHLHHVLLKRGLGSHGTLLMIGLLCTLTAAGGLTSIYFKNEMFAVVSALTIVAALVVSRVFGFVEFTLIAHRFRALGETLTRLSHRRLVREQQVRLQGSRNWDEIWSSLTDFVELHSLARVQLSMNLPWLHENYHAVWELADKPPQENLWSSSTPLVAQGRMIGVLKISGALGAHRSWELFTLLAELLETLQPALNGLLHEGAEPPRLKTADPQVAPVPSATALPGVASRS